MVVPNGRLRKGRIHQIIGGGVLALQEILGAELAVRLHDQHLGVIQFQIGDLIGKVSIGVIPEDQLPHIAHEFPVELVRNLF